MKKELTIFFSLCIMLLCIINVKPVYAADTKMEYDLAATYGQSGTIATLKFPDAMAKKTIRYHSSLTIESNVTNFETSFTIGNDSTIYVEAETAPINGTNKTTYNFVTYIDGNRQRQGVGQVLTEQSKPVTTYYTFNTGFTPILPITETVTIGDVNTYEMDTMHITKPVSDAKLTFSDAHAGYPSIEIEAYGKMHVKGLISEKDGIINKLNANICSVSNGVSTTLANSTVEVYGEPAQWEQMGYYNFKIKGLLPVTAQSIGEYTISIGTSCPTLNDNSFHFGFDYVWISDTITISTDYYIDMNGDGKDDKTGEPIPASQTPITDPSQVKSDGSLDLSSQFNYLLGTFASFSGFIGGLFSFLPKEIQVLFICASTVITALMIKRAVL